MQHRLRVDDLYHALEKRIQLKLLAGEKGLERTLIDDQIDSTSYTIVGPLSFIHPNRIQLIGHAERDYLNEPERNRPLALEKLFKSHTRIVILVDKVEPDDDFIYWANEADIALLSTPLSDKAVLDHLQHFAALHLADQTTLHGVFLEVLGMGVLLTGDPAIGKSELALELITRGHRLIADDAPVFSRIAPDTISGECPAMLREFLEVRGLGILNIRAMFGDSSIKNKKFLRLIVHLEPMKKQQIASMERLSPEHKTRNILGVEIPQFTIPVAPGRNLGVLVESAVRNHMLKLKGYDATEVLIQRQQEALLSSS